jgi:NADH-quinone oxidoreductase subunit N
VGPLLLHAPLAALDAAAFARFAEETRADLARFGPEIALVLGVAAVSTASAFLDRVRSRVLAWPALASVLLALHLVTGRFGGEGGPAFSGMLRLDPFADFFGAVFLVGTAVAISLSLLSRELIGRPMGEYHASLLCAALGMMLMAEATDLVMLFIAVETLSLPSYALAGWRKADRGSSEAALKYVLYGSVAAGVMVYGMSLLYGLAGSTRLAALATYVRSPAADAPALAVAATLVAAGLGFKMAAVPLHFWAPDVYQGAPTAVVAWLSVTSKAAGIAALLRFAGALGLDGGAAAELNWTALAAIVSMVTMTLGNLGALHQTSLKRLLAYSSIAHVGYALVGVAAMGGADAGGGASGGGASGGRAALAAVAFYVVAYLVMNMGAFACVMLGQDVLGADDVSAWRGVARRAPRLAVAFTVFLVALIGIPPTVGFSGKAQLFLAALERAGGDRTFAVLVVVAAVNTALSAYYYLRVVKAMLLDDPEEGAAPVLLPPWGEAIVATHAVAAIGLGLYFDRLVGWTREIGPLR